MEREPNAGGVQLQIARLKAGLSQMDMATALDVHSAKVSAWERFAKRPGVETRPRIKELYGIDWPAWEQPPSREQLAELRRLRDSGRRRAA